LPQKGFKSITIREELYDDFMKIYKARKGQIDLYGYVPSFSAFVIVKIEKFQADQRKLKKITQQIKIIPDKFLVTTYKIKVPIPQQA